MSPKRSKNARHTGPRVARSSAHAVAGQHPSFLPRLPLQAFLPCAGCCETHSARVFKENYTRAPLKHSHTMACTRQGSTLSQLRCRRSFEVTFVRDIYCELFIALIGCCFLLLHFSCPLSKGGRDSFAVGRGMIAVSPIGDGLPLYTAERLAPPRYPVSSSLFNLFSKLPLQTEHQ